MVHYQPAPESPKPCIKITVAVCLAVASCTTAVSLASVEAIVSIKKGC